MIPVGNSWALFSSGGELPSVGICPRTEVKFIGVRGGRGAGGCSHFRFFFLLQNGHFGQKANKIRAKPLDFRASAGEITALLFQKEASDPPSKAELLMFSYLTYLHVVRSSSRSNCMH